uniref:SMG1 nonsense mediated mRNA decay associated PI3K related kinase n=1 Tax=Gorilla gorilla gorilla TaxID=9595 RepID=A0A2I2Z7S0_GORGO
MSYSDESRLSNLLRRITREDDRDRRLATVKQLKEFIQQPENKLVRFLCFHNKLGNSSKLLQELRQEGACCLGLLCASLSYEAEKIFKWIFSKFSSSAKDEVKLLYLCATYKALETVGEKKAFSSVMQVRMKGEKMHDVLWKKIVPLTTNFRVSSSFRCSDHGVRGMVVCVRN